MLKVFVALDKSVNFNKVFFSLQLGDDELCTAPPTLNNGRIAPNKLKKFPNGSNVKYKCDEFYDIDGKQTITCVSGKWTNPPTCRSKYIGFCQIIQSFPCFAELDL